ncbi:hypothetical protein LAUMK142_02708 [Mycobacterium pseudokansasii]|uniref:Chromosome partition protein Smc n=1 Tax=Mycobacterium pseudokansasii TaxID=2341080 RepID=A0A498QWQ9_9MYCO|nr:hypothetical protein LAUMK142_02708 [Mycobacterium pseudokansasii]
MSHTVTSVLAPAAVLASLSGHAGGGPQVSQRPESGPWPTTVSPSRGVSEGYQVTTFVNDPTPKFERTRNGYDPAAVNQYIAELMVQRQAQHYETERLRVELAALRDENAVLRDTSSSAPAVTDRLAKMLRFAVDEVFQMQSEARAEASALIAAAKNDAEAARVTKRDMLAQMEARQRALDLEHAEAVRRAREEADELRAQAFREIDQMRVADARRREKAEQQLDAELIRLRSDAQFQIDDQLRTTQQECDKRLNDAKAEAERRVRLADEQVEQRMAEARRMLDDVNQRRLGVLEQLARIHAKLEDVPAILESARCAETDMLQSMRGAFSELRAI